MATFYWVGGSGNWDATSTTNWASTSGGAGGAGVPTSADDVIFDAGSNIGTDPFTVTVTGTSVAPSVCNDFSTGGAGGALDGAMTLALGATAVLNCHGSMTLPATGLTWTGTQGASLRFSATTTGKTVTTNGVTLTLTIIEFNGLGGEWTLGSALTTTTTSVRSIDVVAGTFNTNNFNITSTTGGLRSIGTLTRVINLGSSTVSLVNTTAIVTFETTGLTFNAGTSTITSSVANPTLNAGGVTFYNVTFTSTAENSTTINGANTFNNLTQSGFPALGLRFVFFGDNQTINGTLTFANTGAPNRRYAVLSSVIGAQRTLTVNAVAGLQDVDFRDINAAGTSAPWSGTRLGNCLGNSNITFDPGVNKYFYNLTSANFTQNVWELTAGGTTPNVNNIPLAQDTMVFQDFGLNAGETFTTSRAYNFGSFDFSGRTLAMNFTQSANAIRCYGDITLSSAVTMTGAVTAGVQMNGQGITQNLTSAGVASNYYLSINAPNGTVRLLDNFTSNSTTRTSLTIGSLDLNDFTYTSSAFDANNANVRSIEFGATGKIAVFGNNTPSWNGSVLTNFTFTGTSNIELTYAGAVGTRTILSGGGGGATEANSLNFNIIAGTDIVRFNPSVRAKNVNFTGFAGTYAGNSGLVCYGDLIFSSGMTIAANSNLHYFAAASGVQQVTTNGITVDFPIVVGLIGIETNTVAFQDALTQGSTRQFALTSGGTVQFKDGVTSTVGNFTTSGTTQKFLQSTTPGSQATLSQASGTVNVSYLTIQDINATGGAVWYSPVDQLNVDAGNNDGWDFFVQLGQYMYTRRKNKRLLIS